MKKDDLIRRSLEENLSGLHVSRQQQMDIIEKITEGRKLKKKLPIGVVLAAVIVLGTLTAALAVGIFTSANWLGEVIPDEQNPAFQPCPTNTPIAQSPQEATFEKMNEILNSREDREWVIVSTDEHSAVSAPRTQAVYSMGELMALVAGAKALPLPNFIPDGYAFSEGTVFLDCLPEGEFHLTSREALPGGLTVERYNVDESMDLISGYDLIFRKQNDFEDSLYIYVSLEPLSDLTEPSIGLNPDQRLKVLDVAGMEHALAVISDNHISLSMRRTLDESIHFRYPRRNGESLIDTYGEVQVNLMTGNVEIKTLADMFCAEK